METNFNLAMKHNLNTEALTVLSYIENVVDTRGSKDSCIISFKEITEELKIIFKSESEATNLNKLRKMINSEGFKVFVTREVIQRGRGKGADNLFKINKEMLNKLKVKNILGGF